jgi:segregation and condensation protein B
MTGPGLEAEPGNGAADLSPAQPSEPSISKLAALEAVLFMAADPLSIEEIAEILDIAAEQAELLTAQLSQSYQHRGLQLTRIAGGYQVSTRPEYGPYVAKLHAPERFRLSRAALETLAIVAYKQPVTRPEIEAIRGVNSDSPVDTLAQYQLICEAGRRDAPGRAILYRTTDNFLGHFGLNSVDDLPRLDAPAAEEGQAQPQATDVSYGEDMDTSFVPPEQAEAEPKEQSSE